MSSDEWSPPFKSHLVLQERIKDPGIRSYYVGFDQGEFRLIPLANVIINVVPEFALGFYEGAQIDISEIVPRLREAAQRVYSTDNYQRRGEFGELILHLLLRDFCRSVPLISKIYFKDADNVTIHGFDAVHVVTGPSTKQLWLGESKLYDDGRAGVRDLVADLERHIQADYLRREFALIATKLPATLPEIEHWRNLLHANQRLDAVLDSVCIPMVCTYTSPLYGEHRENTRECLDAFVAECRDLETVFKAAAARGKAKVSAVLFLVPVKSKPALVNELHRRLNGADV